MSREVLERVVQRALSDRGSTYEDEIRRLMAAGLTVMVRRGAGVSPRVADIVAEAGLHNDAFYRYFPSKAASIRALMEDGAGRLHSYLAHQMAKDESPEAKIRRWVDGILAQASGEVAAMTRAVLCTASGVGAGEEPGPHPSAGVLAPLLHLPLTELGSRQPQAHARLIAHATLGALSDRLWGSSSAGSEDRDAILAFCLAVARTGSPRQRLAAVP